MLSETLKIFFVTHEKNAGLDCVKEVGLELFSQGFIRGYRACFGQHMSMPQSTVKISSCAPCLQLSPAFPP